MKFLNSCLSVGDEIKDKLRTHYIDSARFKRDILEITDHLLNIFEAEISGFPLGIINISRVDINAEDCGVWKVLSQKAGYPTRSGTGIKNGFSTDITEMAQNVFLTMEQTLPIQPLALDIGVEYIVFRFHRIAP